MTLLLWVEIGCSGKLWPAQAGCTVWWEYTLPRGERSDPSQSCPELSASTGAAMSRLGTLPLLVPALDFKKCL